MRRTVTAFKTAIALVMALVAVAWFAPAAQGDGSAQKPGATTRRQSAPAPRVVVTPAMRVDTSTVPLRDLPPSMPAEVGEPQEINPHQARELPGSKRPEASREDPLRQSFRGTAAAPDPIMNFEGGSDADNEVVVGFRIVPPDTNGDVGLNHYVQWINLIVTIYNKEDGSVAAGPFAGNDLFAGFGGPCETTNNGDPTVLYDQFADRWVLSQFANPIGTGALQCVAVSTTGDPTGTYHRYAFATPGNDYPKMGVWPDAYHMTYRNFAGGDFIQAVALERAAMLNGDPAQMVRIGIPDTATDEHEGVLPPHVEGLLPPPTGAPAPYVMSFDDEIFSSSPDPTQDFYKIWHFSVDWANPSNSTVSPPINVPTAEMDINLCGLVGLGACIEQPAPGELLHSLAFFTMWRAVYHGGTDTLWVNNTVDADGNDTAGIRWAEIADPTTAPAVNQAGTYAPADGESRWMGSLAVDDAGNMMLGYSTSSTATFPSVRYTGRLASDPPGVLDQDETELWAGTGAQTGSSNRWGDYSSMSLDESDGCTFWYTQEYYETTGSFDFHTRIGSTKFDACGEPGFALRSDVTAADLCTATSEAQFVTDINVISIADFVDPVTLDFDPPLPSGFTGDFVPNPVIPGNSSTTTITVDQTVAPDTYPLTVLGTAAGADNKTLDLSLTVFNNVPDATTLLNPPDGTMDVDLRPTFEWTPATFGTTYHLEVSDVADFSTIVYEATVTGTSHQVADALAPVTQYFWRVTPQNICGDGLSSNVFSFTTRDIPPILVVDDDNNNPDVRASYTDALDALGLVYDIWDTVNSDNEPSAAELTPYEFVVWFTGVAFGGTAGPGPAGEASLAEWLDGGGCFFISSQDYLFDRGLTPFMQSHLGVGAFTNDVGQTSVTGAGSVFGGLGPYTLTFPFTNFSDTISPDASSELAFAGNVSDAAVNKDGGAYQTTFWGFPFETLPDNLAREETLEAVVLWCGVGGDTGFITGTVTDADDGAPIAGASVSAGTRTVLTNADGQYTMRLPVGVYDVTASAENYVSETVTGVVVELDQTTTVDFALQGSSLFYSPDFIEQSMQIGDVVSTTVTVSATGPLPVDFSVRIKDFTDPNSVVQPLELSLPASDGNFTRGEAAPSALAAPADGGPAPGAAPEVPGLDLLVGSPAYAQNAAFGFYTVFDLDVPEVLPNVAPFDTGAFIGGGEFVDGSVYMLDGNHNLHEVDPLTGGLIGTIPVTPPGGSQSYTGMALDPTSGVVYATSCDITTSQLFELDVTSGTATLIGSVTNSPCTIGIAVDGAGELYGYDIVNDSLLNIDKATGAGTIVGSLGFDANFGQGMAWDPATDTLFLAAFNNGAFQGELRAADRDTGNTTLVGVLGQTDPGGLNQLGYMAVELSTTPPWAFAVPDSGTVEPGGEFSFEVIFDASLVEELGTHTANLRFSGNFSNEPADMPLTMHVTEVQDEIVLTARGYRVRGKHTVDLTWEGSSADEIDIYRDGALITTVPNSGFHTDSIGRTGRATYVYKVCNAGTSTCSNEVIVRFGGGGH